MNAYISWAQDCSLLLQGQVFDRATLEPLEFAVVFVQELQRASTADSTGRFEFTGLCSGNYHLKVNHLGCVPGKYFLSIRKDTFIAFYLDHHDELLKEVIVQGRPENLSGSQTQQAISSTALRGQAGRTLSDITDIVAGVRSLRTGSGIGKPVIHGLYGNRIAVINNGVIQAGQQWGADHAPEIDPNTANLITVVKGSDVIEYGTQAIGGAVIIDAGPILRDPHIHGAMGYAFHSNGLGHMLYSRLTKSHNKIDWRWTGSMKKEGDHRAPGYFLTNTGANEANTSLQMVYRPHAMTQHQVYYSLFTTTLGVFAGSHISNLSDLEQAIGRETPFNVKDNFSYHIVAPRQQVVHHLLKYAGKSFVRDDVFLEWIYGLQSNHRQEFDIRRGNRSDIPSLDLQLWAHVIEAKYFNYHGAIKFRTGLQAKWTDNTNDYDTGIRPLIPDYTEGGAALFTQLQFPVGNFTMETGARIDFQRMKVWAITRTLPYEIIQREHHFRDISVAGGVIWKPSTNLESRFNTVLARRSPEVNELYSNGLHQGIAGIEEGDWELNAETSIKSILTQSIIFHEAFHLDITAHSNLIYQYIYLKPDDELRLTIRGSFPVYTYVQEDAWIKGVDATLISHFSHTIEWATKVSVLDGRALKTHKPLSLMPPMFITSSLSWSWKDQPTWKGTKVRISGEYTAQQKRWDKEGELLAPPNSYFLLDASLETSLQWTANMLHLGVYIENIFNIKHRDYLNRLRYFADEQGRGVRVNIRYEF